MKIVTTERRGIPWTFSRRLEDLDEAYDICMLAHTHEDMEKLNALVTQAAQVGLKINIRETKVMRIHTRVPNKFSINGYDIEKVSSFCYLGSFISNEGGAIEDVLQRINKA